MKPTNLTILITGGSSGLGSGAAELFLNLKNKIIILDINPPKLPKSPNLYYIKTDITSPEEIKTAFQKIEKKKLQIDIILNSAGTGSINLFLPKNPKHKITLKEIKRLFSINIYGTISIIKNYLSHYKKNNLKKGLIINISSISAEEGQQGQVAYAMSKGAINSMTLPLARELGTFGIRVVGVMPGVFRTEMTKGMSRVVENGIVRGSCVGRVGLVKDFAVFVKGVVECGFLTGVNLRLDGGARLPKL